jgi:general secretion pathway protein B
MSYILEALKKAQAERQLGSTPGLDALSIQAGARQGAGRSMPLWGALGAVTLVAVAAVAMLLWRQGGTSAPAPAVNAPAARAEPVTVPTVTAPAPAAATAPPVAMTAPVTTPAAVPVPAPMPIATPLTAASPMPVAPAPAQPTKPAANATATAASPTPAPALARAPAREAAAAPAAPAAIDEGVASARELPEAIQRQLPKVVFGGYIYSKNAEDRLLLVDKVLRHEGEEVAPGLTLERLLPKAAVMNFRGYRYRVAY